MTHRNEDGNHLLAIYTNPMRKWACAAACGGSLLLGSCGRKNRQVSTDRQPASDARRPDSQRQEPRTENLTIHAAGRDFILSCQIGPNATYTGLRVRSSSLPDLVIDRPGLEKDEPVPAAPYAEDDYPGDKVPASLQKFNAAHSDHFLVIPLSEFQSLLFIFSYPYASDPPVTWIISLRKDGTKVLFRRFLSVMDLKEPNHPDQFRLIGVTQLSECTCRHPRI